MAGASMRFDTSQWQAAIGTLKKQAPKAIARALNRAATSARAGIASPISKDMGLKVGDVKTAIRIQQATPERQSATLVVKGARLPLIKFRAKGAEPSRGQGRGVTARVQGVTKRYPNAFIATMPTGHRGVFQRRGRSRLPINELFGASLPHVFHKFRAVGQERGEEAFLKNLESEFAFLLRGLQS